MWREKKRERVRVKERARMSFSVDKRGKPNKNTAATLLDMDRTYTIYVDLCVDCIC